MELYNTCGFKYKLKYIERWEADQTPAALLFGTAIDKALNYVLIRKKHNHTPKYQVAEAFFLKQMNVWQGQNELIYFKGEAPTDLDPEMAAPLKQKAVWDHLVSIGLKMIQTYIDEILPNFKRIIQVQTKKKIDNGAGDVLVLVTDFLAELQDGRIVIFDNKTSSDIKKNYGKSSVANSTQLAIYTEYETTNLAGYVALQKKLVDGKISWTMVVDSIQESKTAEALEKVDSALENIKAEIFEKNQKSCYLYNKPCEFYKLCKFGNSRGLLKK